MKNKINQKEFKRLTWKYFFQQKREEIFRFFKLVLSVILFSAVVIFILVLINNYIAYPFGKWLYENVGGYYSDIFIFCLFGWMVLSLIGAIIYCLSSSIWNWIKSNWRKAKERAEKELG